MQELIDIKSIKGCIIIRPHGCAEIELTKQFSERLNHSEIPRVEAEPVLHWRWKCIGEYEEFSEEMADYLCESCGYVISRLKNQKPKFCEGCGARMDATDTNDGSKGGIIL